MDKKTAIAEIDRRAAGVRLPIYLVCKKAKVAPSTVTRWRSEPDKATWSTIGRLETALSELESAQ